MCTKLRSKPLLIAGLLGLVVGKAVALPATAPVPPPDSSKVYTFVAQMPVYPGGRGWGVLLADLRREFGAASGAVGCPAPTSPVSVNLLVGPSGVIYRAEFVNNLPPSPTAKPAAGHRPTVADTPPGPALSAACEAALQAAVRRLPRLQAGRQHGQPVTVRLTLPLVPKAGR